MGILMWLACKEPLVSITHVLHRLRHLLAGELHRLGAPQVLEQLLQVSAGWSWLPDCWALWCSGMVHSTHTCMPCV